MHGLPQGVAAANTWHTTADQQSIYRHIAHGGWGLHLLDVLPLGYFRPELVNDLVELGQCKGLQDTDADKRNRL